MKPTKHHGFIDWIESDGTIVARVFIDEFEGNVVLPSRLIEERQAPLVVEGRFLTVWGYARRMAADGGLFKFKRVWLWERSRRFTAKETRDIQRKAREWSRIFKDAAA